MHIGNRIKEVMKEQKLTAVYVAQQIDCERTNIYNVFARKDINTELLLKFSRVLGHNFFDELSKEYFSKTKKSEKTKK